MAETVKVAVDAMGGDYAPEQIVAGAVDAVKEADNLTVYLFGQEKAVNEQLAKYTYDKEKIVVVDAPEIIETAEHPVMAIRKKKESSIVKGLKTVKEGECDAFVSGGNSGAVLVGGQLIVGRLPGVERAPFAPLIPTEKGACLLLDCGANVDARPEHLVSFAKMGSIYAKNALGKDNPTVGIVNIGAEEEKGNALVKETFPLLKECKDINFIGSVESREIPYGAADIVLCEAFVGNVILKLYEGMAKFLISHIKEGLMSTTISKIGAAMAKPALKKTLKGFSIEEYGGAPLLGLNGLVVKTHGNAKAIEIKNAILQCLMFKEMHIKEQISENLNS